MLAYMAKASMVVSDNPFFEPANVRIPHFDNLSTTEAAVFVACYLLGPGEDRLIEMLEDQN